MTDFKDVVDALGRLMARRFKEFGFIGGHRDLITHLSCPDVMEYMLGVYSSDTRPVDDNCATKCSLPSNTFLTIMPMAARWGAHDSGRVTLDATLWWTCGVGTPWGTAILARTKLPDFFHRGNCSRLGALPAHLSQPEDL